MAANVVQIILQIPYFIVFITSIVANSCFLAAVRTNIELQIPINILLSNVAISDLLFTILTLTTNVEWILGEWCFTDAFCKINNTFIEVTYTVSIVTLTVISIKKYIIISRNEPSRNRPTKTCIKISIIIWIASILLCSPLFDSYNVSRNEKGELKCRNNGWPYKERLIYRIVITIFTYLLPLLIMTTTNRYRLRLKHKVG